MRSYGDPCGLSRALDLVGERWSLLVVRELLFGPKRFSDLRIGVPNASPNVLAQRLRELEDAGVVQRRTLPPPGKVSVYELTDRGKALENAIIALAFWGSRTPPMLGAELSTDSVMLALKTTFAAERAKGMQARIAMHLGDEHFGITIGRAGFHIERMEMRDPDAKLETDSATLRALAFRGRKLDDARRAGTAVVTGDARLAARFLRL